MKVCVVTPYYRESLEWLTQAHASVRSQTIEARHILICDGTEPAQIQDFRGTHIILKRNYRDYGHTPRFIGCYEAVMQEADAIAFLDADNWYYPDHLGYLLNIAQKAGLSAVSSARMLHRLDGTPMMKCPTVDGTNYVDTSCLLVLRPAFRHLLAWVLQGQDKAAETDQFFWRSLKNSGVPMAFVDRPTVAYRTRHQVHYGQASEAFPPGAIVRDDPHGERYQ
jgi:glycosyltransferase involved in cell wall biosynthesis